MVPYYMLNDLQSTVAAAIKEIKKKMDGGGEIDSGDAEDMELEDDEDDFIAWLFLRHFPVLRIPDLALDRKSNVMDVLSNSVYRR